MSRADLTRLSELSRSTVGALVSELADLGLVREVAPSEHSSRGRPSPLVYPRAEVVTLAINPDLDAVTVALVGLGGTVHRRVRRATLSTPTVADTVSIARDVAAMLLRDNPTPVTLVAAGVAVPGLIRADDGWVVRAPHLDWTEEPLGELLEHALGVPVAVRNDARVATIAETVFGAGRGVKDLVYVNGSASGIGGGAVIDGQTLRGRDGYGGELGHMVVPGGRESCHCGRRGCLETEVNLPRLLRALRKDSVDLTELDEEFARASTNHELRVEVQRQVAVLAGAVGNLVSIFNPELVILGGFLGSLYAAAPGALTNAVSSDSFEPIAQDVRIERAQLGARAHLVGAAELAFLPLLRDPASFGRTSS